MCISGLCQLVLGGANHLNGKGVRARDLKPVGQVNLARVRRGSRRVDVERIELSVVRGGLRRRIARRIVWR